MLGRLMLLGGVSKFVDLFGDIMIDGGGTLRFRF